MHGQGRTTKKSERGGTESGTKEKLGEWVLIDETNKTELLASGGLDAPLASTSEATESVLPFADAELLTDGGSKSDDGEDSSDLDCQTSSAVASEGPLTTEHIFSSFFNVVTTALLALQPDLALTHNLSRTWSAANSSRPVPGEEIPCKPDLTLLDDVEARWDTIKVVCELTSSAYKPSSTLAKTLDTKAYLLLKHQPWRWFALLISLCNGYRDLRVHLYDHSGGVIESTSLLASTTAQIDLETEPTEYNPAEDDNSFPVELPIEIPQDPLLEPLLEPIGKIRVIDHFYDILDIIFSRQGLVGRSTVCYHARKDDEEFIIKDYWAIGGKKEALNEIRMMEKMEGVRGVPQLVEYWLVEVAPGKVDQTVEYHYKSVRSLQVWDIVQIQKEVVEQHNVLHHDCSLFNAMIEDDGNGTHRMLIDWEFSVRILKNQSYTVGGTGTLPFMSRALLLQLHLKTPTDALELKGASSSKSYPPPLIKHCYQDDLESMFYVFIWILIEFRGPLGMKRILNKSHNWILQEWSALKFKTCCDSKTSFFWHDEHYIKELTEQIHPYFKSLIPVVLDWYKLMKNPKNVHFDDVLAVLNNHLADLPINKPSPELLVSRWLLKALKEKDEKEEKEGTSGEEKMSQLVAETLPGNKNKRVIDYRWTMEAIPKPKRCRR
ncbi:uncharacterized protein EDB93DRAFT_1102815 [Suillus bovinus]|uniref:uncharacterized protein n=1 Tax=Suillus bovinus TaxID=48563 RepID=UPI001B86C035|nr:uncharacterized protein EDB93DRAFT_1102815 [Suillus bovinus]KAG2153068.1 hypothetical protein EDB93DRAFT_1102815 [Suillus bovinus]